MKNLLRILIGLVILVIILGIIYLRKPSTSLTSHSPLLYPYKDFNFSELNQETAKSWFSSADLIGNQTKESILANLTDVENPEFIRRVKELPDNKPLKEALEFKDVWKHTSHAFGFIPKSTQNLASYKIQNATTITPDPSLKNAAIKIKLDRLVATDYPGKGEHSVLFDFYAKNHIQNQDEHIHFNQVYRIVEGEQAGILGYPVFSNLNVGPEGVDFKCYTVNVENKDDKNLVSFLEGDLFKSGLKLLNSINPVTPMLSNFAKGFTDQIKNRNKNIPVQDIYLGLDVNDGITTSAKLAEGSYVVIQVPDVNIWNWDDWIYKPSVGQIVSKADETKGPPFNYFVFSISKM